MPEVVDNRPLEEQEANLMLILLGASGKKMKDLTQEDWDNGLYSAADRIHGYVNDRDLWHWELPRQLIIQTGDADAALDYYWWDQRGVDWPELTAMLIEQHCDKYNSHDSSGYDEDEVDLRRKEKLDREKGIYKRSFFAEPVEELGCFLYDDLPDDYDEGIEI